MPSFSLENTSIIIAALVVLLALYPLPQGITYCYTSITTLSAANPSANCFTVSPYGTFARVFEAAEFPAAVQEAREGYVIPGLWDGHGHLLPYGELLHSVDLFGADSMNEAVSRVEEYVEKHRGAGTREEWVRGVGWDQAAFGRMPMAVDLEASPTLKGKYIMLGRIDVHCIWVSQAILQLLPDPIPNTPGGEVVTDPGMGVFCDNAMDMVMEHWPKPDRAKKIRFVKAAMRELNRVGLVGVHDAGVTPQDLRMYEEVAGTEDWSLRVYAMVECEKRNTFCPDDAFKVEREDGMLSAQGVKLFADGALGSWGSAMIEPYTDHPWKSGSLLVNASTLTHLTHQWSGAGYQVNIHAIGDLANRLAVNSIYSALERLCPSSDTKACQSQHRFRIEHAQIIHPDDQKRINEIGIIPSIQPTHATSDMSYAELRLGKKRTNEEAYRMHSLLPARPVLGSDFPVEPPDPFQGIFAAATRRSPRTGLGADGEKRGWYIEEALTLRQALEGFTKGPAYGAFLEGRAGVIEQGAWADWVLLDKPLEGGDVDELRSMKVKETWVGGKLVYRRED